MKTGYYGYVIDNLDTLPERKTKVYQTYEEAHKWYNIIKDKAKGVVE